MPTHVTRYVLALFFIATILTFIPATGAQAQGGSMLFVAPHRVVITPDQRATVINVTNKDETTREFKITPQNYIMDENSSTKLVDDFEYSAAKMIRYVPRRVKLGPGERQAVRIMAKRPADLPDGDYHTHLLFDELVPTTQENKEDGTPKDGQVKFEIKALYSLAIPVVVQKGALQSELTITGAELLRRENGKYDVAVAMSLEGNSEGNGFLTIEHTASDGTVEMIGLGGDLHIYREARQVTRKIPVKFSEDMDITQLRAVLRKGGKPTDEVISSQPVVLSSIQEVEVEK